MCEHYVLQVALRMPASATADSYLFMDCLVQVIDHYPDADVKRVLKCLRTGMFLGNPLGRSYFKHMLDVLLEKFRRLLLKDASLPVHLVPRCYAFLPYQHTLGCQPSGQASLALVSLFNTGCFRFHQQLDPSRLFQNMSGDAIYSCTSPSFTSTLNLTRCLDDQYRKVQTLYRVITDELGLVQVELFIPAVSGLDSPPLPESECLLFHPD